jgi:hypothetical protein
VMTAVVMAVTTTSDDGVASWLLWAETYKCAAPSFSDNQPAIRGVATKSVPSRTRLAACASRRQPWPS